MLGYTSRFACNDICLTNTVKQGSLTMVNMPHDSHNRRTGHHIFVIIFLFLLNRFLNLNADKLNTVTKLICNHINRFCIKPLVDGHKQAQSHTSRNHLRGADIHHGCQFGNCNKLCQLQHLLFLLFLLQLCLHLLMDSITLLSPVLGRLRLAFAAQPCHRVFNLLFHILIRNLRPLHLLFLQLLQLLPALFHLGGFTARTGSDILNLHFLILSMDTLPFLLRIQLIVQICPGKGSNVILLVHKLVRNRLIALPLFLTVPFPLLPALFGRTRALINRIQINRTHNLHIFQCRLGYFKRHLRNLLLLLLLLHILGFFPFLLLLLLNGRHLCRFGDRLLLCHRLRRFHFFRLGDFLLRFPFLCQFHLRLLFGRSFNLLLRFMFLSGNGSLGNLFLLFRLRLLAFRIQIYPIHNFNMIC